MIGRKEPDALYHAVRELQADGKALAVDRLVRDQHSRLCDAVVALRGAQALLERGEGDDADCAEAALRTVHSLLDGVRDQLDSVRVLEALAKDAPDLQGVVEVAT